MNGREYIDVWRVVCNGDKRFTWRLKNPRQQARLDVFIVSSDIYNIVTEFDIKAGYKTDHSRVILIYNLHNIHKSDIHFTIEDSLLLETILMNIKGLTIQYAARKSEKLPRVWNWTRETYRTAGKSITKLPKASPILFNQLTQAKQQFSDIHNTKTKGIVTRTKANWANFGDKPTQYFLALEKINFTHW